MALQNESKQNSVDLVISFSALKRTRLSRCGESQRKQRLLMPYFPLLPPFWRYSIQCAAAEKEPPNKYRNWDIYQTPHPRQPSNSDMRTDECSVCACTYVCENRLCPAHTFHVWVMTEGRGGVHACLCARHTSLKTNSDWKDGIVHQVQQTCDPQSPGRGSEKAVQAFHLSLFLPAQPLPGIILNQANNNQRSYLQLI